MIPHNPRHPSYDLASELLLLLRPTGVSFDDLRHDLHQNPTQLRRHCEVLIRRGYPVRFDGAASVVRVHPRSWPDIEAAGLAYWEAVYGHELAA